MSDVIWCGVIAAAMFGGVLLIAIVTKLREVRKASLWISTPGKVVTSRVQARKKRDDAGVHVRNYPFVEYEYEVGGRAYTGNRINIGENTGEDEVDQMLAKYPEGAGVLVFYDPNDPEQSLLERDLPPGMGTGIIIVLALFIGGPILAALAFSALPGWLAPHLPNPQRAPFVVALSGMGLFAALIAFGIRKQARQARSWPVTEGLVLTARVEQRQSRTKHGASVTLYCPSVVYAYEVDGRRYAGSRISLSGITGTSNPKWPESAVAKYAPGAHVRVHYNPKNAAESVLEHGTGEPIIIWIIVAILLGAAYLVATRR